MWVVVDPVCEHDGNSDEGTQDSRPEGEIPGGGEFEGQLSTGQLSEVGVMGVENVGWAGHGIYLATTCDSMPAPFEGPLAQYCNRRVDWCP